MPNSLMGEDQVDLLDGRTLVLAYNFEALMAAEEISGLRLPDIFHEMAQAEIRQTAPSLRVQRALLYGALRKHHPEIGPEECGSILLLNQAAFAEASERAMKKSMGPIEEATEDDSEEDPPLAGAGTGSSS